MSEFPPDWTRTTFGNVLKQRKEAGFTSEELLAVTSSAGIVKRDSLERRDTSNEDKSKYLLVEEGDIAYNTMRMWQGVSGVSRFRGIVSPAYTICTPTEGLDKDFAGYLLKDPEMISIFRQRSQGLVSDTWNLKYESFAQIPCTIPPLPEQKKIAEILSGVDALLQLTRQKLSRSENLRKTLSRTCLDNMHHDQSQEFTIGELALGKYGIVDGPFGSNLKTEHYRDKGIPVIQSGFVTSGEFFAENYKYVDHEKYEEQIRSSVSGGDLVMAKIGANAGRSALMPYGHQTGILAGNCLKITPNQELITNEYLSELMNYYCISGKLAEITNTTAQPAVSMSRLKELSASVPTIEEQKRICKYLHSLDDVISYLKRRHSKILLLKQALTSDLLSGRKRVSV
jgi:type I restriction enzyme S subunit